MNPMARNSVETLVYFSSFLSSIFSNSEGLFGGSENVDGTVSLVQLHDVLLVT